MYLYEITNLINGMGYVGITKGRVKHRWWSHKKDLRTNKHGNKWLQNAYNKYGPEAFEYKVRQKCSSIEELSNLEKEIIKNEKDRLYNIKDGGYDAPPVKHTEESKRKISEASRKPVVGMCIKTGEIKEYKSGIAAKKDGFWGIKKCCTTEIFPIRGRSPSKRISSKGGVWMYKSEFNIEEMNRRAKLAISRGDNDQSRAIIGKSLVDGSIKHFKSCMKASKELNVFSTSIRSACLGDEVRSTSQFVWVFADETEPTILLEERYEYALKNFNGKRVVRKISPLACLNLQTNEIKVYFSKKSLIDDGFDWKIAIHTTKPIEEILEKSEKRHFSYKNRVWEYAEGNFEERLYKKADLVFKNSKMLNKTMGYK